MRSDEVSYFERTSSGSSRTRWSITGTIGHDVHSCCAIADSVPSGSNFRCRT